jgi:starvation-inducible DNA-binding protein
MKPTKTRNSLPAAVRTKVCSLLNDRLADAVDLSSQCKQAHWNVKGPSFIALHELFDDVYEEVVKAVDDIAERIVQLGGVAEGTARTAAKASNLKEFPRTALSGDEACEAFADRLAAFGTLVRDAIETADKAGDADTADLFTGVSRATDKMLWFVESHLQK